MLIFFSKQISEKDLSLLEERIKRAAKNRPVKSASSTRISAPTAAIPVAPVQDNDGEYDDENDEEEQDEPEEVPEER